MTEIYINNPHSEVLLVFLHGWCLSPESFREQINYFQDNYSILAPDYSLFVGDYSINKDNLLLETANIISKRIIGLKVSRAIFIGHSMGGIITLMLASQFISITSGCIIIDTTMPSSTEQQNIFGNFLGSLRVDNEEQQIRNFITRRMFNPHLDNPDSVNVIIEQMINRWRELPDRFNQLLYQAVLFNSETVLRTLKSPLMYVGGTPACGNIEKLKEFKDSILIKNMPCGHFIMNNLPQDLNITIENFIRDYA